MQRIGMAEENRLSTDDQRIENAQTRVEAQNFSIGSN